MGSRKNLREFEQTEKHGKKFHLCGEREDVIKKGNINLKVGKYIGERGLVLPKLNKLKLYEEVIENLEGGVVF